jgi:hypothetical protein
VGHFYIAKNRTKPCPI